jgi:oligoendopeptidase F
VSITVRQRQDVPIEDTWDLESIYPTEEAWEAAVASLPPQLEQLSGWRGRLGESAAGLADWLKLMEAAMQEAARIMAYASLAYSVETSNQETAARQDRARGLFSRAAAAISFAEPELLALGKEQLEAWMEAEPRLGLYDHFFDSILRRREHVRSAEVETLLKQVFDPFGTATATHRILSDTDLRFVPATAAEPEAEPIEIAQGNIGALLTHADRSVRRTAWEHYADSYLSYKNSFANVLATGVKQDVFFARARNYESSLAAALTPNNIPTSVFHNTIETFKRNLPLWHRYWRVRRQALGYETMYPYDVKAPLTAKAPEMSFAQAADWICEGMAPLGEEYV